MTALTEFIAETRKKMESEFDDISTYADEFNSCAIVVDKDKAIYYAVKYGSECAQWQKDRIVEMLKAEMRNFESDEAKITSWKIVNLILEIK